MEARKIGWDYWLAVGILTCLAATQGYRPLYPELRSITPHYLTILTLVFAVFGVMLLGILLRSQWGWWTAIILLSAMSAAFLIITAAVETGGPPDRTTIMLARVLPKITIVALLFSCRMRGTYFRNKKT